MMRKTALIIFFVAATSVSTSAEISKTLDYQGRLMDASGRAVADGSYTITVSLWNDPASTDVSGHRLWANPYNVTTKNGYFHLILGDGANSPLLTSVNFNQPIYAETQISGDPNPLPRQLLNAVPYAMTVAAGVPASKISLSNGDPLSAWESSNSPGYISGAKIEGGALFVNGSGNVGIGTTNPGAKLDVRSAIRIATADYILGSTGSVLTMGLGSGNTYASFDSYIAGGTAFGNIVFHPTGNGNIGIGLTSPNEKLSVNGNAANTTGVWGIVSDHRLKKDIVPIRNALETITRLQGVQFHWKDPEKDKTYGLQRGFIAQDVEKVIPEWVKTNPDGYLSLEKVGAEAILVEAVKELKAENDSLKARLKMIEDKLGLGR